MSQTPIAGREEGSQAGLLSPIWSCKKCNAIVKSEEEKERHRQQHKRRSVGRSSSRRVLARKDALKKKAAEELKQASPQAVKVKMGKKVEVENSTPPPNAHALTDSDELNFGVPFSDKDELASMLKREVSLVQGTRSRRRNQDDGVWEEGEVASGGGDVDSGTKVVKIKCSVFHGRLASAEDEASEMKAEAVRMFKGYCLQNGIPLVLENTNSYDGQREVRPYWKKKGKTRWQIPAGEERQGTEEDGTRNWAGNTENSEGVYASGGPGGGGGGKRPPPSSSSDPDSRWDWTDDDDDPTTDTTTDASEARRKRKRKPEAGLRPPKLPRYSLNKIYIRSYGLSGKLEKISKIDRRNLGFRKLPGKHPVDIGGIFSQQEDDEPWVLEEYVESPNRKSPHLQLRKPRRRTIPLVQRPTLIRTMEDVERVMASERNSEWIHWDSGQDDDEVAHPEIDSKEALLPIQPNLQSYIASTSVLDCLSSILGLSPYTKLVRNNKCVQVLWISRSPSYVRVCLNAILFFTITLSIFSSLLVIFGYEDPLPTTHQIIKVDFAHHFLESFFLMLFTLFLTIWSVSCVLELGVHYAEFYSRFNMGIVLTEYDVTEDIVETIRKHLFSVLFFELGIGALFFAGNYTPIVRESFGFLGFLLLRPFNFEIRESIYFPFVELLGLGVFLYSFLCLNVVLLQFAIYAKALGNMARQFNLRLAFTLESNITKRYSIVLKKRISKVIPFNKLYAEHLIIASLFQNISHVNSIVFGAFVFSMIFEIVLVMWLFFDIFLEAHLDSLVGMKIERSGSVELAVPIRLQKLESERLMRVILIFAVTWLTYWIFGGVMHNAGAMFHTGIEYVKRHGLVGCRSLKERRFIMSLIVSFTQKSEIWIGRRFHFNRPFLIGLMGFVIGASMVTISFRPDRTAITSLETCTDSGYCSAIKVYKTASHVLFATIDDAVPPSPITPRPPPTPIEETTPPPPAPSITLDEHYKPPLFYVQFPPCSSFGSYPYDDSAITQKCPATWSFLSEMKLPYLFKPISWENQHKLYGRIKEPFKARDSEIVDRCRKVKVPLYNFPYTNLFRKAAVGPIVDCFGNSMEDHETFDDCSNPPFETPKDGDPSKKEGAILKVISTSDLPQARVVESILCCYEYTGYQNSGQQVKTCNTPSAEVFLAACQLTATSRPRFRNNPHILQHYNRISIRMRYELEVEGGNRNFLEENQEKISKCLCKLKNPQVALDSEEHCQCTGLYLLPCLPDYFEEVYPEDYSVRCGAVLVPLLFKVNSEKNLVFYGEHERYGEDCMEDPFRDKFSHTDSLIYRSPCKTTPNPPPQLTLVDCAGNPIVLGDVNKDDCSNFNISTPDVRGRMLRPRVSVRAYNYDVKGKTIVEGKMIRKIFLCCFLYQGQDFRRREQDRYCNAPGIGVMNKETWCKAVITSNNGKRQPNGINIEPNEQQHRNLELAVRYHEAIGNGGWLENLDVNQKWTKCICPDKLEGFNETEYEQARLEECNPLVPTPGDLHSVGIIEPFPICDHKWPSTVTKIGTPAAFTFHLDIWNLGDRFKKRGGSETSTCHKDNTFDERYTNNGSPTLYDSSLNQLPPGETDDCFSLPIPTSKATGGTLQPPKLRLASEFGMNLLQPGQFATSTSVHCCYYYVGFPGNQHEVCNMPEALAVKRKCRIKPRSSERKKHESELVRRLIVAKYYAEVVGNRVPPFNLDWDSSSEKIWRGCICGDGSTSAAKNEMCEGQYLPPCVIPKGTSNQFIVKLDDMFTPCPATWMGKGAPTKLSVPIILEYIDKTFKKTKFKGGSDCPDDKNDPDLSGSVLTDCVGQDLSSPIDFDNCKNPTVNTLIRSTWIRGRFSPPQIQLVAVNQLPGFKADDERFFCCWKYAISEPNEVWACNMPSKTALERRCSFSVPFEFTQYVELLKIQRKSRTDPLASSVSFTDEQRMAWTLCLCQREIEECKEIDKQHKKPFCFKLPTGNPIEKRLFTECYVPGIQSNPRYSNIKSIFYPTIFHKEGNGAFTQIMPLGRDQCEVVGGAPPLPPSTLPTYNPSKPIFDCEENTYEEKNKQFWVDDCDNPIMNKKGSSFPSVKIRAIVGLASKSIIVSCCVDYEISPSSQSERQAQLCNKPTPALFEKQCRSRLAYKQFSLQLSEEYAKVWHALLENAQRTFEVDYMTVQCLCRHLQFVRDTSNEPLIREEECSDWFTKNNG